MSSPNQTFLEKIVSEILAAFRFSVPRRDSSRRRLSHIFFECFIENQMSRRVSTLQAESVRHIGDRYFFRLYLRAIRPFE